MYSRVVYTHVRFVLLLLFTRNPSCNKTFTYTRARGEFVDLCDPSPTTTTTTRSYIELAFWRSFGPIALSRTRVSFARLRENRYCRANSHVATLRVYLHPVKGQRVVSRGPYRVVCAFFAGKKSVVRMPIRFASYPSFFSHTF